MRNSGHMPNLPSKGKFNIVASLDPVYSLAMNSGYHVFNNSLPTLYYQMRKIGVEKYGYTYSGFYSDDLLKVIREVGNQYGYTIGIGILGSCPMEETDYYLSNNNPYLLELRNHSIYGNHMAVVYGYKFKFLYVKISGMRILFSPLRFFVVHNGHVSSIRYIDFSELEYNNDYTLFAFA